MLTVAENSYVRSWGRWHVLDRVDAGGWHAICGLLAEYDDPVSDKLPEGAELHEACRSLLEAPDDAEGRP